MLLLISPSEATQLKKKLNNGDKSCDYETY